MQPRRVDAGSAALATALPAPRRHALIAQQVWPAMLSCCSDDTLVASQLRLLMDRHARVAIELPMDAAPLSVPGGQWLLSSDVDATVISQMGPLALLGRVLARSRGGRP